MFGEPKKHPTLSAKHTSGKKKDTGGSTPFLWVCYMSITWDGDEEDEEDEFGSQRNSIFGRSDELKVAPKGIDKDHP